VHISPTFSFSCFIQKLSATAHLDCRAQYPESNLAEGPCNHREGDTCQPIQQTSSSTMATLLADDDAPAPKHPVFVLSRSDHEVVIDMSKVNDDSTMSQCVTELKKLVCNSARLLHPKQPNGREARSAKTRHSADSSITDMVVATNTTQSIRFHDLARELRDMIYLEMEVEPQIHHLTDISEPSRGLSFTTSRRWADIITYQICRESRAYAILRFGQPFKGGFPLDPKRDVILFGNPINTGFCDDSCTHCRHRFDARLSHFTIPNEPLAFPANSPVQCWTRDFLYNSENFLISAYDAYLGQLPCICRSCTRPQKFVNYWLRDYFVQFPNMKRLTVRMESMFCYNQVMFLELCPLWGFSTGGHFALSGFPGR